jgi:hypothetical protein
MRLPYASCTLSLVILALSCYTLHLFNSGHLLNK